jgi:hypothetical protein
MHGAGKVRSLIMHQLVFDAVVTLLQKHKATITEFGGTENIFISLNH